MRKIAEINNLRFSYPDGTRALDYIDLDIFEGDSLGIIGPNGAGKSTLLLHLNGILSSEGQDIRILGMEVKQQNLEALRRKVGVVFQSPDDQLFMPVVFDDVAFGPLNMGLSGQQVNARVNTALSAVDMRGFSRRSSHHLSLGEKKRISIATVLSMNPEIIVLDEPSSNLDPRHRRDIINLLKGLNLSKVIATHDLDLVMEICSKVALLDKGKVVAYGDTSEILEDRALLESHNLELPFALQKK